MTNHSQLGNESQSFNVDLSYPKRNLSAIGWYSMTDDNFDSDLSFKWTQEDSGYNSYGRESYTDYSEETTTTASEITQKVMRAALNWRNEPLTGEDKFNQSLMLALRHPSFTKDVTFQANCYKSNVDLINGKLVIDYCDDPEHLLTVEAGIKDQSTIVGFRNYSANVFGHHEVSELNLDGFSSFGARPGLYETKNYGIYKRGYLPLQDGILVGALDLNHNEVKYHKTSPYKTVYLWFKTDGQFPVYTINGTVEDSPDVNSTGKFYLNLDQKFVRLEVNMTPDASQNLQMLGTIPNARSASLDLWRDYEDIRIVDISYYLRMNHSRLVTSQLIWRPKMRSDIKVRFFLLDLKAHFLLFSIKFLSYFLQAKLKQLSTDMYNSFSENVDFWVKTIYTETTDTINDVWINAKPYTQEYLNDIGYGIVNT